MVGQPDEHDGKAWSGHKKSVTRRREPDKQRKRG